MSKIKISLEEKLCDDKMVCREQMESEKKAKIFLSSETNIFGKKWGKMCWIII